MSKKLRLGITIGDFNGIGPELILKAFSNGLVLNYCTPVIYANAFIFKHYASLLELNPLDLNLVRSEKDVKDGVINLRKCSNERIEINPGQPSVEAGKFAVEALELAVADLSLVIIHNIVTGPIDKKTAVEAGLQFNGHTGYFADKLSSTVQMILLNDSMRVAMVTGHTSLDSVSEKITMDAVVESAVMLNENLQADFAVLKPRIAVLSINPHAGDNGLMGNEETDIIIPALKALQEKGIMAYGPYSADGFFGSSNRNNFDAVLGMYHDQVLGPFKQIAFSDGVNYTAGLPIVRTSPDHGTAFDIAGKGIADIGSFVNSIYLVNRIHRNRLEYYDNTIEPLEFRDHRKEKFSIGVPDLK
jgi:4-hydroxythreonine-4-phosphate dehydrogenase